MHGDFTPDLVEAHAVVLAMLLHLGDGLDRTADDCRLVSMLDGHAGGNLKRGEQRLGGVPAKAQQGHCPWPSSGPPCLRKNDPQGIAKAQHATHMRRCHFTDAMADCRNRAQALGEPHLGQRYLDGEMAGPGDFNIAETFLCVIETFGQGPACHRREQLVASGHARAENRVQPCQPQPHAWPLRPLTGEHQQGAFRLVGGRHHDRGQVTAIKRVISRHRPLAAHDHVGIGATETEGAHPRQWLRRSPGRVLQHRLQGQPRPVDRRVGSAVVEVGRYHPMLQREQHLDQPGHPRCCLGMADIGLHRTDEQGVATGVARAIGCGDGSGLYRVAHGRAGTVGLDVLDIARSDPGLTNSPFQQCLLGLHRRRREAVVKAVVVDHRCVDHPPDRRCRLQRVR